MSEQFLFWAIKNRDAYPNVDGSTLDYGRWVLARDGICSEADWPYNPVPIVGSVGQGTAAMPSALAIANAQVNTYGAPQEYHQFKIGERGAAALVLKHLSAGRVVAVTVPVFRDQVLASAPDNWNTLAARTYGRIINPPSRSTTCGGHAFCVAGFVPDSSEPRGGYFVFRNSWGTAWASLAPDPALTLSPEAGYGVISASYIEDYPWELLVL